MSNEELAVLVQAGERERLVELWGQTRRLVLKKACRWVVYRSGPPYPRAVVMAQYWGAERIGAHSENLRRALRKLRNPSISRPLAEFL